MFRKRLFTRMLYHIRICVYIKRITNVHGKQRLDTHVKQGTELGLEFM